MGRVYPTIPKRDKTGKDNCRRPEKIIDAKHTIIHRLKLRQSIRRIHRELGVHRPLVRELHRLAIAHQWLDLALPMPSDEEIASAQKHQTTPHFHLLDDHYEQIKHWDKDRAIA